MALTKKELVEGLRSLGVCNGDLVLVHTSLASLGEVEGGAEAVCDALIEACGPDGTVAMPTMGGRRPWNVKEAKSILGVVTETFRLRKDTVRSLHPTHSVTARGPRAEELTRDHYKAPTSCGRGTPYGRLIEWGGKILLVGCDQDRNTTLHALEDFADQPYLTTRQGELYDENGSIVTITMERFPGPHRDFIGTDRFLREAGVMKIGKIGRAVCRLMDARGTHNVLMEALKDNPALFLCENPNCQDCVQQRGKIKERQLRQEEDFILTASTDMMDNRIPKIVLACQGEGIREVEVSTVEGVDVLNLSQEKANALKEALSKAQIMVSAIRSNPRSGDVPGLLKAAKHFGARRIVAPLTKEVVEKVKSLPDEPVEVLLENTSLKPEECLELIQGVKGQNVRMAFSPANFARLGLHPFLGAYYWRRNKFGIRQLVIADATYEGEPTLPGQGNGEVKELISILRCRSFDGTMCLRGPLAQGKTFREHAAAFWHLLDTL